MPSILRDDAIALACIFSYSQQVGLSEFLPSLGHRSITLVGKRQGLRIGISRTHLRIWLSPWLRPLERSPGLENPGAKEPEQAQRASKHVYLQTFGYMPAGCFWQDASTRVQPSPSRSRI